MALSPNWSQWLRFLALLLLFVSVVSAAAHAVAGETGRYPDLPKGVTSFGAAMVDDHLYVYGGHFGEAHHYSKQGQSNQLLRLNLARPEKWETVASGPRLQGLAMVACGGKLYRVGGFSADNDEGEDHDLRSVADFVRFDPQTKKWTKLPDLSEPRSSHDAAVLDGKLYVIGGWRLATKGRTWHETAWVIDLSQQELKWQELPKPPFQRQDGGPTTRVEVFDPARGAWSRAGSLVGKGMEGFGSAAFAAAGRLYVSTYNGNLQFLDKGGEWKIARRLEADRFFHRMLPYRNRLVLVGGASMKSGKRLELETAKISE